MTSSLHRAAMIAVLLGGCLPALPAAPASGATLVYVETSLGWFNLQLFDGEMPRTVANFASYVRARQYDGTVIHRNSDTVDPVLRDFVIYGGGYRVSDPDPLLPDGQITFESLETNSPIDDEPGGGVAGPSNLRGTIAMARQGSQGVTSEWFINQGDNSWLDDVGRDDGGLSAFGWVLGNGMEVVDAIGDLATPGDFGFSFAAPHNDLPLRSFGGSVSSDVRVAHTVSVHRVALRTPRSGDFDLDGDVDRDNLETLLSNFGTTSQMYWDDGDADMDGDVDGGDFLIWQHGFTGSPVSAAAVVAAVPELPALGLACAGIVIALLRQRRIGPGRLPHIPRGLGAGHLLVALTLLGLANQHAAAIELDSRIEMFVDRLLLETVDGVDLKLHPPQKQEVVLPLNGQFETSESAYFTVARDEHQQVRLYYRGNVSVEEFTLLAISEDGTGFFKRPVTGHFTKNESFYNNIVFQGRQSHNLAPFLDTNPNAAPDAKWKALGGWEQIWALKSADGIHWEFMQEAPLDMTGAFDSQNTSFWDPLAGVYRSFSRYFEDGVRAIQMSTSEDFINWTPPQGFVYDVPHEHFYTNSIVQLPQAEQIFLGFPMRLDLSRTNLPSPGQSGVSDAVLITSRDGVHWDRTFSEPWIPEGFDTTRSNMPAWGIVPTAPDEWSMYASQRYQLSDSSLVRLTFRPYGLASVHADQAEGSFQTPPLSFAGDDLVLNFSTTAAGSVAVEVRDEVGQPIPGFLLSDMNPLTGDSLAQPVEWSSGRSLGDLAGQSVRLYFELVEADLFALQFVRSAAPAGVRSSVGRRGPLDWESETATSLNVGALAGKGVSQQVPEPTTVTLLLIVGAASWGSARRKKLR